MPYGVTGNTPDLGSGDFQVRPLVGQQNEYGNKILSTSCSSLWSPPYARYHPIKNKLLRNLSG